MIEGPLESISLWLERAGHPRCALISVGATRYTPFGEETFLDRGDRAIVAVYDERRHSAATLRALVGRDDSERADGVSILCQTVI